MNPCSSLIGTHEVRDFIAFSKSESKSEGRSVSIIARLVACRISNPLDDGSEATLLSASVAFEVSGEDPSKMKASHTRS